MQKKSTSRVRIIFICTLKSYVLMYSEAYLFERKFPFFSSFIRRLDGASAWFQELVK